MYVVYSNCLYFLSIFLFTYNKNLRSPQNMSVIFEKAPSPRQECVAFITGHE